jgi:4'-phosphopantetheinyl transferase
MIGSAQPLFQKPDHISWDTGNDIHVWKFPVIPTNFYFLNDEEKIIAQRFRFDEDRVRFSVGRQSLRLLLSRYLSVQPLDIVLSAEKNQKPFLISHSSPIHFNISHSGGWVLIALATEELGIDIEMVDEDFSYGEILSEHFNPEEGDFITKSTDPVRAFYYLWTRKEALTKAWGTGLQENLKAVNALHSGLLTDTHKKTWEIESFSISSNYPAALAYSTKLAHIFYFEGNTLFL